MSPYFPHLADHRGAAVVFTFAALLLPAPAQGGFVNYEVGAVVPLALQTFVVNEMSRTVLMACNTGSDALEFYDASTLAFVKSIPTGLAPVTVRWSAAQQRAYTCNFLGDSLTSVAITASDGGGFVALDIRLEATFAVGDEPSDIAFVPGTSTALVSLRSRSAVANVDLATRSVLDPRLLLKVDNGPTDVWAAKNPTNLGLVGNDRFYALDHQSDGVNTDLSLFAAVGSGAGSSPLFDPGATRYKVNGLGTAHAGFVLNAAADRMFVVGMRANPQGASTELGVGALPTGFVESWLWVVDLLPTPVVRPQSTGPNNAFASINLNRDYTALPALAEVPSTAALAQPTGVALVEAAGSVKKVVITAFSSDVVVVLTPSSVDPSGWAMQRMPLTVLGSTYSMVGPRHVVVDAAGQKAYVLGALDCSLRTFDISGVVATPGASTSLHRDDTPLAIRTGREFLYGAKHSGNHMVSCSSCHVDGHTDGVVWTLNQPDQGPLPDSFKDNAGLPATWPANKGPMVTQTLRGLVNHDVPGVAQEMFTNAPYHWRGDRGSFGAFNGAFVALMNRTGGELAGTEMAAFTTFVETIHHPPNPEQAIDRRLAGDMGGSGWDPALGSGAKRGLKLYHGINFPQTCAHCHVLPEGSGNRATQTVDVGGVLHPIEPAALRHVFDFESGLQLGSGAVSITPIQVKAFGLFHNGFLQGPATRFDFSTAHFIQRRFRSTMPGTYDPAAGPAHLAAQTAQTLDLTEFVRGLDTGTAPIIGFAFTCGTFASSNSNAMNLLLDQAYEANAGIVAHTRQLGVERSYWFDVVQGVFRDDVTTGTLTPTALLALVTGANVVVLQAVPVGSERRIADRTQLGTVDSGPAPSNVTLEPMTFPTQWADGGDLQARWDPSSGPQLGYATSLVQFESHMRMSYMQTTLLAAFAAGADFGINRPEHVKHELPRRFRVAGDDIREGATLELSMRARSNLIVPLVMPLFPTRYTTASGHRIWETAVEADGEMTLALLNGGLFLPNVWKLVKFVTTSYPVLDPANDNNYAFVVRNKDLTSTSGSSPLRVSHVR